MRILLAALAAVTLTSGAQAYCYSVPDSEATGYTTNNMDRTLCLQGELSQSTNARNRNTEIDATIGKMQRDLQTQKFMLQQQQSFHLHPRNRYLR